MKYLPTNFFNNLKWIQLFKQYDKYNNTQIKQLTSKEALINGCSRGINRTTPTSTSGFGTKQEPKREMFNLKKQLNYQEF